jgi:hypothetical protein
MAPKKKKNPNKPQVDPKLCADVKQYLNKVVDPAAAKRWKGSVGGEHMPEALPQFIQLDCEDVWEGKNNTYIVLGRDRPGSSTSGYVDTTQAGAIDIVVGRMGSSVVECGPSSIMERAADFNEELGVFTKANLADGSILEAGKDAFNMVKGVYDEIGEGIIEQGPFAAGDVIYESAKKRLSALNKKIYIHPMFQHDAARIYISQKSDVDENFKLVAGKIGFVGKKSRKQDWGPAGCIAIKSDDVRVIARRGIKLVTMGPGEETTSQSRQPTKSIAGINIIAGNKTDGKFMSLQPMVKGENLVECLENMQKRVNELSGILGSFLVFQHRLNGEVAKHTHRGMDGKTELPENPVLKWFVGPSTAQALTGHCQISLENWKKNMGSLNLNSLSPSSSKYICSRWNYVN